MYTDQNVDGDTFSTLPTDKNSLNEELDCKLTLGGWKKLCKLITEVKGVFNHASYND